MGENDISKATIAHPLAATIRAIASIWGPHAREEAMPGGGPSRRALVGAACARGGDTADIDT